MICRGEQGRTLCERLHMPDVAFALGDDVVVATANQVLRPPRRLLRRP